VNRIVFFTNILAVLLNLIGSNKKLSYR